MNDISLTQTSHVYDVIQGNESISDAVTSYAIYSVDIAAGVAASPVTTVVDGYNQIVATWKAFDNGDWEGVGEHGYQAAADVAHTAMFFLGAGEAGAFRPGGARRVRCGLTESGAQVRVEGGALSHEVCLVELVGAGWLATNIVGVAGA
jgi:hypothetical protein